MRKEIDEECHTKKNIKVRLSCVYDMHCLTHRNKLHQYISISIQQFLLLKVVMVLLPLHYLLPVLIC